MARDAEYSDSTRPFDGSYSDVSKEDTFTDPTGADPVEQVPLPVYGDPTGGGFTTGWPGIDSTAYTTPAGDPFDDALLQQPDGFESPDTPADTEQPTGAIPAQPGPAGPPRWRPPADPPPTPRPSRPQGPPPRRPQGAPSGAPQAKRQPAPQPAPPPVTQPAPPLKRKPASPMSLDNLTKRPPMRKSQPRRPKPPPQRTTAMARFPVATQPDQKLQAAPVAPTQQRRGGMKPIWPILVFIVILVALIRGCADSRHNNGTGPYHPPTYSTEYGGVPGLP